MGGPLLLNSPVRSDISRISLEEYGDRTRREQASSPSPIESVENLREVYNVTVIIIMSVTCCPLTARVSVCLMLVGLVLVQLLLDALSAAPYQIESRSKHIHQPGE